MKIGVLIGQPTQFEGPFFQFAAKDLAHQLRVIYTNRAHLAQIYDPELNAWVSWGIDLLGGYNHAVLPAQDWQRWLRDDLRREHYDLFIVNGYCRAPFVYGALAARWTRTPVALRLDSVLYTNASWWKRSYKRTLFALFKHIYQHFFAISPWTIEYLRFFGVRPERISLFSYAIDVDYFRAASRLEAAARVQLRERYGLPAEDPVILSVAKFHSREAPWDLLKAFEATRRRDWSLLLVGDGPQRAAIEAFVQTHPDLQIRLPGYVPYPDLPKIYRLADVFVHPAAEEVWGVSVAEALACSLPVIASSRVGAGHALIVPGKNGFTYTYGDVEELSNQLRTVLSGMPRDEVCHINDTVLAQWNYEVMWRNILEAGRRFMQQ